MDVRWLYMVVTDDDDSQRKQPQERKSPGNGLTEEGERAMLGDSYLYLQLAKERAKEGLRKAEQARHIQAASSTRRAQGQLLLVALGLSVLMALVILHQI